MFRGFLLQQPSLQTIQYIGQHININNENVMKTYAPGSLKFQVIKDAIKNALVYNNILVVQRMLIGLPTKNCFK